ncbi:MAG TPA: prephenate dehydrogenase dimerization domain-containing protein [Acidimicrobiales bacterium]|nr:prephenate dehydrogenase dimerization domain-containing protein [Acidimicrobiales bacterium]
MNNRGAHDSARPIATTSHGAGNGGEIDGDWRDRRCVVAGGLGGVGSLFVQLLLGTGARVSVVDPLCSANGAGAQGALYYRGDVATPGPAVREQLRAADIVVLAIPEPAAVASLATLTSTMRPGALLADTLSVKTPYLQALGRTAQALEILSLNPMFAPSLDMATRPVAVVSAACGPLSEALVGLLARQGARVVPLGADEHDRLMSAAQALTHAAVLSFGIALAQLGVELDALQRIAPPPHATMLALLARMCSSVPQTYWDIQAENPFAPAARRALAEACQELSRMVGDQADAAPSEGFVGLFEQIGAWFGDDVPEWAQRCAATFQAMGQPMPAARPCPAEAPTRRPARRQPRQSPHDLQIRTLTPREDR